MVSLSEPKPIVEIPSGLASPVAKHALRASQLFDAGRTAEAVKEYDAALDLLPTDPDLLNNRAIAHAWLGNLEAATRDFESALGMAPHDSNLHMNYAIALLKLGFAERALAHLNEAVSVADGKNQLAATLSNRGLALAQLERIEESIADFRAALECAPESLTARLNLAAALARSRKHKEAVAAIDRAWEIARNDEDRQSLADLRQQIVEASLRKLVRRGIVSWSGDRPKGSDPPVPITPGPPVSDYVIEDRG